MAKNKNTTKSAKGSKTLPIMIAENDYEKFITNRVYAKQVLAEQIKCYPELFPSEISAGYVFNGYNHGSQKMGQLKKRKIWIGTSQYHLHPSFVLPDMRGNIHDGAYYALWLRKYHVPYWLLVELYGRNVAYWWRLETSLAKHSLVGTTVYGFSTAIPSAIVVDEHHIKVGKEKHYIATTVGKDCFLGAEVSRHCDEVGLTTAYRVFQAEAQQKTPAYQPQSINTDGWKATVNAMQTLFPMALLIRCFLHAFLKVRTSATKQMQVHFNQFAEKIWACYRAPDKRSFSQRLRRLKERVEIAVPTGKLKSAILALCAKRVEWTTFYQCSTAHRTSNMLDRLMKFMDRHIFVAQGFHGSRQAANKGVRAFCLLYNFAPSCPRARKQGLSSPAARLNGFVYTDNWLENLLMATAVNTHKSISH